MRQIEFIRINEMHIPKIHIWRNKPHMKFWDKNGISLEDIKSKYKGRISGEDTCKCFVVSYNGVDFGIIQYYKNIEEPKYCEEIKVYDGVSIDLFIGEEPFLGRGFGKNMLFQFIEKIFQENMKINTIYICHEDDNIAAIKCSESVGFVFEKNVIEDKKSSKLFKIERNNV